MLFHKALGFLDLWSCIHKYEKLTLPTETVLKIHICYCVRTVKRTSLTAPWFYGHVNGSLSLEFGMVWKMESNFLLLFFFLFVYFP